MMGLTGFEAVYCLLSFFLCTFDSSPHFAFLGLTGFEKVEMTGLTGLKPFVVCCLSKDPYSRIAPNFHMCKCLFMIQYIGTYFTAADETVALQFGVLGTTATLIGKSLPYQRGKVKNMSFLKTLIPIAVLRVL